MRNQKDGKMSIKDVHPKRLTKELGEQLKNREEIQPPNWSHFIKTGAHKERLEGSSNEGLKMRMRSVNWFGVAAGVLML
ncbi:hypothetical protein AKJ57_06125, partial [candidate division MSBL1 archaeon SCGC-AAA259A05]